VEELYDEVNELYQVVIDDELTPEQILDTVLKMIAKRF